MTDTTNTGSTTPATRGVLFYITALLAVLTCPCHLPILLLLLSGTAAGAFLQENTAVAVGLLLPVFVLSLIAAWRLLEKNGNDRQNGSS